MPIPFRCSSCGQEYPLADHHAGKQVKCAFCGEYTRAVLPDSAGAAPAQRRAVSLHEPDLKPLTNLEPRDYAPPAAPQYAMDYIAPPPKVTPPAPASLSSSSKTELPPLMPVESSPVVSSSSLAAPPTLPALPALPRVPVSVSVSYANPLARPTPPARGSANRADVWLLLNDDGAQQLSKFLLLGLLIGTIWFSYRLVQLVGGIFAAPDALQTRFYVYMALASAWSMIAFFLVVAPTLLLTCRLAGNWTRWNLPDNAYVRACGTAALPSVLVFAIILMLLELNIAAAIWLMIAAPVLLIVTLKELMGLKWTTTLIAAGLLLFFFPLAHALTSTASRPINGALRHLSRLDDDSLEKWAKDHPEEMRVAGEAFYATRDDRANVLNELGWFARRATTPSYPSTPPMTPPPSMRGRVAGPGVGIGGFQTPSVRSSKSDPLFEQLQPIITELQRVDNLSRNKSREELQREYDRLAPQVNALKPANGANSPRWNVASEYVKSIERQIKAAPSESPPPEVFQPVAAITESPLQVPQAEASEFQDEEFRFHDVRIRPLKRLKVNVDSFLRGQTKLRWDLTSTAGIELELLPLGNPKQQRPWVAGRRVIQKLAEEKNLLAFADDGYESAQYGRIGEIGWTRIVRSQGERKSEVQYVGRLPDQWLIVRLKSTRPTENEIDAIDKFVQGLGYVKDSTSTTSPIAGAKPSTAPPPPPGRPKPPVVAPGSPNSGEINVLLEVITGSGASWDRNDALKKLAQIAPADAEQRAVAAPVLEQLIATDAAFVADEAANALAAWWRPQTIDVLLPLMDEKEWVSWKRTRAMKVLARTGDKRAALPIMRWLLKDTDAVVAAMIELGPVAEDEAIARLREKEPAARAAAARILSAVGTQKCLIELRRAANDPRDAGAAAAARSALETVLPRVKQTKATTTTSPATKG